MRQIRIAKRHPKPTRGRQSPLPVDPRDLHIVHAIGPPAAHAIHAPAGTSQADSHQAWPRQEPGRLVHQLRAGHVVIVGTSSASSASEWTASALISAVTMPSNDNGAGDGPSSGATRSPVPGRPRSSAGLMTLCVTTSDCGILRALLTHLRTGTLATERQY